MKFTYDWYRSFIVSAKEKGYSFSTYTNYNNHDRFIILRHDVDMSIDKALEMAIFEFNMNISSTYFFLLTSNFYNLLNKENKDKLLQIKNLGHQIGLHFDEKQHFVSKTEDLVKAINQETLILKDLLDTEVHVYSNHRPSTITISESSIIKTKAKSAYSKEFFVDIKYFSDSRMNWRENFDKVIEESAFDKIQVCIHPIWYEETESSIKNILNKFINKSKENTKNDLRNNIRNFDDLMEASNEN